MPADKSLFVFPYGEQGYQSSGICGLCMRNGKNIKKKHRISHKEPEERIEKVFIFCGLCALCGQYHFLSPGFSLYRLRTTVYRLFLLLAHFVAKKSGFIYHERHEMNEKKYKKKYSTLFQPSMAMNQIHFCVLCALCGHCLFFFLQTLLAYSLMSKAYSLLTFLSPVATERTGKNSCTGISTLCEPPRPLRLRVKKAPNAEPQRTPRTAESRLKSAFSSSIVYLPPA